MSKVRFDEIKKVKDKLENLVKSIDIALTQNSADVYNKLYNILKDDNIENKTEITGSGK